jgi:hypothetical protein
LLQKIVHSQFINSNQRITFEESPTTWRKTIKPLGWIKEDKKIFKSQRVYCTIGKHEVSIGKWKIKQIKVTYIVATIFVKQIWIIKTKICEKRLNFVKNREGENKSNSKNTKIKRDVKASIMFLNWKLKSSIFIKWKPGVWYKLV